MYGPHEPRYGFHEPRRRPSSDVGEVPEEFRETPEEWGSPPEVMASLAQLRAERRSRIFPVAAAVIILYLVNALLASTAADVMAIRLVGHLNVGLGLALLQCGTTLAVCRWYARYARTCLDPLVERSRAALGFREEQ
ncbi:DUF485 domain-containing protein [Streptomyces sp. NPDC051636]|uniref:DUF485 domain-containing protein n=1 Tax=Streptomyces sp. NPDC051636 TaxID=3365663 RepID=UPI0037B43ADC